MRFDKLSLLVLLLAQIATAAAAQDVYPSRVVRLAHGFAAGGNADTVSRIIANEMSRGLGQSVVVEPRPGAGGNIASAAAAKSTADGYTMVLLTGGHTVSAALYKSLQFDPVEDFLQHGAENAGGRKPDDRLIAAWPQVLARKRVASEARSSSKRVGCRRETASTLSPTRTPGGCCRGRR